MKINTKQLILGLLCALWAGALPVSICAQSTPGSDADNIQVRRIMAGDRLRIAVQEATDLDNIYAVAGDGTIDVPLIGRVQIEDQTTGDIATIIENKLTESFFREANVTVHVSDYVEGSILVMGEVLRPGDIDFRGDEILTVVEAISKQGGLTRDANGAEVRIIRWKPGGTMERQVMTVDVQSMLETLDFSMDQFLRPRDMILVPKVGEGEGGQEFLVLGEVVDSGFHPFSDNLDVIRAITRAGGFTRFAQLDSARLLRQTDDGDYTPITIDLSRLFGAAEMSMNAKIQPGDILFVPSKEQSSRGVVYMLGAVNQIGPMSLPLDSSMTLAQAILNAGGISQFGNDSKVKVLRDAPDGSKQTIFVDVGRILKTGLFEEDLPLRAGDVVIVTEKLFSI